MSNQIELDEAIIRMRIAVFSVLAEKKSEFVTPKQLESLVKSTEDKRVLDYLLRSRKGVGFKGLIRRTIEKIRYWFARKFKY